jgi:hypothetical protein
MSEILPYKGWKESWPRRYDVPTHVTVGPASRAEEIVGRDVATEFMSR